MTALLPALLVALFAVVRQRRSVVADRGGDGAKEVEAEVA